MRSHGAILLLSCYELGHQPLSLASPLALLSSKGYSPVAIDTSRDELADEAIRKARLVAISVPMHTALRLGTRIAEHVRTINPGAHICFYGLYAHLNSNYLLDTWADSVIGGEYEQPLLELAEAFERGHSCDSVPGVRTYHAPSSPWIRKIPFVKPDRSSLPPLSQYARLERNGELTVGGYTETSRGCLHTCRHCPITPVYGGRFFIVPFDVVMADIRSQVEIGAGHITFGDPDFLNGPGHSMKILRAMHAEFPHLTFDATIKIEHIIEHRNLFPEFHELGCAFVLSAVESLSDTVLTHLDKGHIRADVLEAVHITRDACIPLRPSLLPFTPWATLDDYIELIDFFETHGMIGNVDPVQFTIRLLVPPDSALLDDLSSTWLLGELNREAYTYEWRHPDPRMDELQREVATLVEDMQRENAPAVDIFYAIKKRAYAKSGRAITGIRPETIPYARLQPAPRLTESWFC